MRPDSSSPPGLPVHERLGLLGQLHDRNDHDWEKTHARTHCTPAMAPYTSLMPRATLLFCLYFLRVMAGVPERV